MPTIIFKTENLKFYASEGAELIQAKNIHPDMPIKFGCKQGNCGVCAIHVIEGQENLTKICPKEEATLKRKGLTDHRLACQCALNGNIKIE